MSYQTRYEDEKKTLLGQVKLAGSFMNRSIGLVGRKSIGTQERLPLKKVSCIHMCFVHSFICTVCLDKNFCVVDKETVKSWRYEKFCKEAIHVLGMHESRLKDIRLSEKLVLEDDGRKGKAWMGMFGKMGQEGLDKTNGLGDIRRQYEQAEFEESLKTVLFGRYSKKKINEIISTYKEMINQTQGNFNYRLKKLGAEEERICNEHVILKKRLDEELEKNKKIDNLLEDIEYWKNQCEELMARYEVADRSLLTAQGEQTELLWQCSVTSERLEELGAELKILRKQKQPVPPKQQARQAERALPQPYGPTPVSGGGAVSIAALTRRPEHLITYCESMEDQQRSLEAQISSTKNISQELEKLFLQYEENQAELEDVRRKYNSVKNESYSLNSEVGSASQILREILVQFEQREQGSDRLHQKINEYQEQLMAIKKERLAQDQSNLACMKRTYHTEKEMREAQKELYRTQKELGELRKKYSTLENSRAIRIQSAARVEEVDIPEREKIDELLRRVSAVTGRGQEAEKSPPGAGTLSITSDREILQAMQNGGEHEPVDRRVKRGYLQKCG